MVHVLLPGGGDNHAYLFEDDRCYPNIKTWRWGKVQAVLEWLFKLEVPLRQYWSSEAWKNAAGRAPEATHQSDNERSKVQQRQKTKLYRRRPQKIWFGCFSFADT